MQEILCGDALQQQRRHVAVTEPVGQVQELVGGVVADFRVTAERRDAIGTPKTKPNNVAPLPTPYANTTTNN
ncbi:MAG: hypothetical protein OXI73_13955, partial [Rhodospirillales bacterium]|nr:hypothetical protein [Rhodospirillales bacterium]